MKIGRRLSLGERAYRALLRWLPSDFRGDFGDAMTADAAESAAWWSREIPGLAGAILREQLDAIARDMRDAWRSLCSTPGFTIAAVLMLAVGTGANAALFSVIDAVMLRPAFPDAARVVQIAEERPGRSLRTQIPVAALPALTTSPAFSAVAGVTGLVTMNDRGGDVRRIDLECVSASIFDVVGIHPAVGRGFTADEDRAGAAPVILISDAMWRRDFNGASDVLGRSLTLGGKTSTIIGVMPPGFTGPFSLNSAEAWTPLGPAIAKDASAPCMSETGNVMIVARIPPSMTIAAATEAVNRAQPLDGVARSAGGNGRIELGRADAMAYSEYRGPLAALMGTALCVLLIACANVANYQLERMAGRRREMAVRLALGATRWRVVRHTLTENVMLSLAGAAGGAAIAQLTLRSLVSLMPASLPHVGEIEVNARALAVTLIAAIGCGIAVGLVPAISLFRSSDQLELRASTRGVAGGATRMRRALVVAEVAIAVTLLIGAGLMIRTFLALRPNDLGFDSDNRVIARLAFSDRLPSLRLDDMMPKLRQLPGVTAASASSYMPMRGYPGTNKVIVGDKTSDAWSGATSANFMTDLNMTIARGRGFSAEDTAASAPVAIVNEAFTREFFSGADPVGEVLAVREGDAIVTRRLVGVIRNTRSGGRDTTARSEIYMPLTQSGPPPMLYFLLKTSGRPDARLTKMIRAIVSDAQPGQLVDIVESLDSTIGRAFARPRFGVWLFGAFAGMAAMLAGLGLAAVMAWSVSQRRREIGVRMALGAPRAAVARAIAGEGLRLTATGVVLGLAFAYAGTRLLAEWLYGVTPNDPATFFVCGVGMLIIAAAAAYVPARRAAHIDPAVTLRAE